MKMYVLAIVTALYGTVQAAAVERSSAELQTLYAKYNPTHDRCRPVIRMGASGPEIDKTSLLYGSIAAEPLVACMMAGFKDVTLTGYQKMTSDALAALKEYSMGYILIGASQVGKPGITPELILYTPKGKQQALLLVKVKKIGLTFNSGYLVGFFLGYPEDDIKAFYERQGYITFAADKEASIAWIESNSKDIEKWIADNTAKYDLALGDFKEKGIFA
jgi:hypothetical protein